MADIGYSGRERQRSRNGCRTCRSRKVKCDETPGGCKNCSRLNLPCPNSSSYHRALLQQRDAEGGELVQTQAGLRRSRTYRSCRGCRSSKSRCSGERPTCLRCRQRGFECAYDGKEAPAWLEAASREAESRRSMRRETSSSTCSAHSPSMSPSPPPTDSIQASQGPKAGPSAAATALSWLQAEELPNEEDKLMELVEAFFVNIQPLRSFGFIHKPTVLEQFDGRDWSAAWQATQPGALLLAICALGAKFCALDYCNASQLADGLPLAAGSQWARKAQQLVSARRNKASVESTMVLALLCEHELRVGHDTNAYKLSGLGVRMAKALRLNVELCSDGLYPGGKGLSATTKESRRRLMWAVYIMASWGGTGGDEGTLLREEDMQIQLPCSDLSFELRRPCIVECLEPGSHLSFLTAEELAVGNVEPVAIHGHFIRLVSLRKKVTEFLGRFDPSHAPWPAASSEFHSLQAQLHQWLDHIPDSLRFTRTAIYQRKQASQLGALLLCHFTYHQTMCDLTGLSMKDMSSSSTREQATAPSDKTAFGRTIQDQCFEHNLALCALFEEASSHGTAALADSWLSVVAHGAARSIIAYLTLGLGSSREKGEALRTHAVAAVHSNLRALKIMMPLHALAQSLHTAAINLLHKASLPVPYADNMGQLTPLIILENEKAPVVDLGSPAQYTPRVVMHPLAVYSMPRKDASSAQEQFTSDDVGPAMGSSSELYSDLYRPTDLGRRNPDVHLRSSQFGSQSTIPPATSFDQAAHSVPFMPHAAFTTAPLPPPPSDQSLTMFMGDRLEPPGYDMAHAWGLQHQLPASNDGSFPVYLPPTTITHAMGYPAQQQHWYPGTTSSTPSGSGSFGAGSQHPLGPLPRTSSASMGTQGGPAAMFAPPDPYFENGGPGQVLEWGGV